MESGSVYRQCYLCGVYGPLWYGGGSRAMVDFWGAVATTLHASQVTGQGEQKTIFFRYFIECKHFYLFLRIL